MRLATEFAGRRSVRMAMMKQMAAAVLYAVVGLLGPVDPTSLSNGADGDAEAARACAAYVAAPGRRDGSLVLSAAARLCGEQIDGAWVITQHRQPFAAAAVHQPQGDVAMIDLAG